MKKGDKLPPNHQLKAQRIQRNWTQSQLAQLLGTTNVTISRWESGLCPTPYYREKLCQLFEKSALELGLLEQEIADDIELSGLQPMTAFQDEAFIWNVPYKRNTFFTGRENILAYLNNNFLTKEARTTDCTSVRPLAICGIPGIGKTQVAVEYAYRSRNYYKMVLWIQAETREVFTESLTKIADTLSIPEAHERESGDIVDMVKQRLDKTTNWLLILDNVEDLAIINDLMPSKPTGHILLTTRMQATGIVAEAITMEKMRPDEGILFLLRRAKIVEDDLSLEEVSDTICTSAEKINFLLDGFPLALDQAAAYIEETDCSLMAYIGRYQTHKMQLLNRRGDTGINHPESVTATFFPIFARLRQDNTLASNLLQFCAFLHHQALSEELIITAARHNTILNPLANNSFLLDTTIAALRKYSLLSRDAKTGMFIMYKIIQDLLREGMDKSEQDQWAELAIKAFNETFATCVIALSSGRRITEACYQSYLLNGQRCVELIEQRNMNSSEAVHLLWQMINNLTMYEKHIQVAILLKKARTVHGQLLSRTHEDVAHSSDRWSNEDDLLKEQPDQMHENF